MAKGYRHKDFLGVEGLSQDELTFLLDRAEKRFRSGNRHDSKEPMKGEVVALMFHEPSTRTVSSFELAAKRLGADVLRLQIAASSVGKGESLLDTAQTLQAMGVGYFVIRHDKPGVPHGLAPQIPSAVLNAGDGTHEHPTQALLDLLAIRHHKKRFAGLKVAILGDIRHSRVARSNIFALKTLGAEVAVAGPKTMLPAGIETLGVRVAATPEAALKDADVAYCLRVQKERMEPNLVPSDREYHRFFGLDPARLALAKKDCVIMHPGPVNRGVELHFDLVNHPQSIIEEQVTCGVSVRMAVLETLFENRRSRR